MNIYWRPIVPAITDAYRLESLSVDGDSLIVNGESVDFTDLAAGESLPAGAVDDAVFWGMIERDEEGELRVTLTLPFEPGGHFDPAPVLGFDAGEVEIPKNTQPEEVA